jgi:hypothetical protein
VELVIYNTKAGIKACCEMIFSAYHVSLILAKLFTQLMCSSRIPNPRTHEGINNFLLISDDLE